jgi:hypothetical protein
MISDARRNSGGAASMNGSTGSRIEQPTSVGMRSRWRAQAMMKNLERSEPSNDSGDASNTRQEELIIA